jgi:hypothetical protein
MSANTFNEFIEYLVMDKTKMVSSTMKNIAYFNDQSLLEDAKAELVMHLWDKYYNDDQKQATMVAMWNRGEFKFWLVRYCTVHLRTKGTFHKKYSRYGITQQVDVTNEEGIDLQELNVADEAQDRVKMDGRDIQRQLQGILYNQETKKLFSSEEIDLYCHFFIDNPSKNIPTSAQIAREVGLPVRTVSSLISKMNKHLREQYSNLPNNDFYLFVKQ